MGVNDPPLCEAAQRLVGCNLVTEFGDVFDSLTLDEMRDALFDLGVRVAAQRQREEDGD